MNLRTRIFRTVLFSGLTGLSSLLIGCDGSSGGSGFSGVLSGAQVVPPVSTSNSGSFTAMNTAGGMYLRITVNHDVPDLTGITVNGAAPAGQTAPVLFDILANQIMTRGNSVNSPVTAEWEISEQARMYLNNGLLYIQLNSSSFPDGELRGQINGPTQAAAPEGGFAFDGFNTTFLEGTLVMDGGGGYFPKIAGYGHLDNTFDLSLSIRGEFASGSEDFADVFETPPNSSLIFDGLQPTGFESDVDIPSGFSEFFPISFGASVSSDRTFSVNWEAFDSGGGSSSPLATGAFNIGVTWRPSTIYTELTRTLDELDSDNEIPANTQLRWTIGTGVTGRPLSFTGSLPTIGQNETQIQGYYAGSVLDTDFQSLGGPYPERGAIPKPCGIITDGLFVCPEFQTSTPNTGAWLIVAMILDGTVPQQDPTNFYTYGFVFDGDNSESNNFVNTNPDFENDFFQGTDLWYTVNYDPTVLRGNPAGWTLSAVDASGDGNPQAFFTDAGAIIRDNVIVMLIPTSEVPAATPGLRVTAFRHPGDFGQGGDFGLDYDPGLGEPLLETFNTLP